MFRLFSRAALLSSADRLSKHSHKHLSPRRRAFFEPLEDRSVMATLTVTSLADDMISDGQVTLREALQAANTDTLVEGVTGSGADTIVFDSILTSGGPATLRLNGTELVISSDVTITGPGANLLTINGDSDNNGTGNSRIFSINNGNGVADQIVAISGVTLTKGNSDGGAIFNRENLTLTNCIISGNTAYAHGGGIYNYGGSTATLTNCTLSGNSAVYGGGIYNYGGSTATLTNSTLSGNSAYNYGGGIYNGGVLSMTANTISENSASETGGGIFNESSGMATVTFSTISENTALGQSTGLGGGAGIFNQGNIEISDSDISNNAANYDGGGFCNYGNANIANSTVGGNRASVGGGIYNYGALTVTNGTIADNTADTIGGGISMLGSVISASGTIVTLKNTIVAENANPGSIGTDFYGTIISDGFNLIGNTSGNSGWAASDLLNVNPLLAPLGNYGGPTQTMALRSGSLAINAGTNSGAPTTDQRGVLRDTSTDIGAYEAAVVNLSIASNSGTEVGRTQITVTATASVPVHGNQTVTLAASGTGITSSDYAFSSPTMTIADGTTVINAMFIVNDDLLNEGSETATLTISNPSLGVALGTTTTQNVVITDNDNSGISNFTLPAAGDYRIVLNTGTIEVRDTGNNLITSRPAGSDPIVINGTAGDDRFIVDFSGGSFSTPITFNGGENGAGGDELVLQGGRLRLFRPSLRMQMMVRSNSMGIALVTPGWNRSSITIAP